MKFLVTGANGQLGYDVIKLLDSKGLDYLATDRDSLDITIEKQVVRVVREYNPDVVIHCAAYTAVDKAENEKEMCYSINVLGTKYLTEVCKDINAKMVYISTDYVFNGEGEKPFEVTDKPNPINYYGQTKYLGELEVQKLLAKYFIVRISWVFGINGSNFVKTMCKLGKERNEISVVADQFGSPTYTSDLAKLIVEMAKTDKYGVYHASNEGYCNWYDLAREIFKKSGMDVKVNPINTKDYSTKARRPRNSMLSKSQLTIRGFDVLPGWEDGLRRFINELMSKSNIFGKG
ncbi:MAG: dTDP-4-dehydrorhamnose reductase [Candidatus Izemoplasmataceae bacterium]